MYYRKELNKIYKNEYECFAYISTIKNKWVIYDKNINDMVINNKKLFHLFYLCNKDSNLPKP